MENKIYALIGPHGAGKATIVKRLHEMGMHVIPHYTTYEFKPFDPYADMCKHVSREDFPRENLFVRFTHKGGYFGLKKEDVFHAVNHHEASVTILEKNGIRQLRNLLHGNLVTIYLMVDYMTIVERLMKLGYQNADMKFHLTYAENNNEFDMWKTADYVVKNVGTLDVALRQILAIMALDKPLSPDEMKARLA